MEPRKGREVRFRLLGVGAMNSPRFAPAGLLVEDGRHRVMLDGGPGAEPMGRTDAWLVTDDRAELIRDIRARAQVHGIEPRVEALTFPRDALLGRDALRFVPRSVIHTSHPTWGYEILFGRRRVVWAPEFFAFPEWAAGCDLMFAEASSFDSAIHFAGGVGGHMAAVEVAHAAKLRGVKRLVLAHIGRRSIAAIDRGREPPFGEWGVEGRVYAFGVELDERPSLSP